MYLKRFNLVVDGDCAFVATTAATTSPQKFRAPSQVCLFGLCCSRYTGPLVLTVLCRESLVANQREPLPLERTQTAAGKAASSEVVDATSTTVEAATPLVKAAEAPAF